MTDPRPEELLRVEQLIYDAKFKQALDIIAVFEKNEALTPKDQLSTLILKGNLFNLITEHEDAVEMGERAYQLSKELGMVSASIDALIIKAGMVYLGKFDEAVNCILEAEKLYNSIDGDSSSDLLRQRAGILHYKSWISFFKSEYDNALETAMQCLRIRERIGKRLFIAYTLLQIGFIYKDKGEYDTSLDYAMKSMELQEELGNQKGIVSCFTLLANNFYNKGDLNQALKYCKQSLSNKEINLRDKPPILYLLGSIYKEMGQLNRALKYSKQAVVLAEETNAKVQLALNTKMVGIIYRMMGDYDHALEHFNRNLTFSEEMGHPLTIFGSLIFLILLNLDINSRTLAQKYLTRVKEFVDQKQSKIFKQGYLLTKALVLKTSGRSRNRADAETLLKQIVDGELVNPYFYFLSLVSLCDLLLEELYTSNDPEILDEITPLITRLITTSEQQHSFLYLTEAKLLQAKLALIEINTKKAKKLMVDAQRIAELHDLKLLAQEISKEHDNLLEQIDLWDKLDKDKTPIAERIKLASTKGVLERMQGKRAIEPPELTDEEPVLLLIITEGGIPAFSNPFTDEWIIDDGRISNFLRAFNVFSEDIFAKGLDRAKFGEYTLVMDSIGSFSVCYLFKGQSYVAKQKLIQFAHRAQNTASIWQVFKSFQNTHQSIKLSENPPLQSLITEIFIKKSPEITTPTFNVFSE